jgi:hypothetical protein
LNSFTLRSAVTAPGSNVNEDAYGVWPNVQAPQAAWVLDGVTGINDRALLPGTTDAAWFVTQVQDELPGLLAAMPERPVVDLVTRLVDALATRQQAAWLSPAGADGRETPAASFALFRHLGNQIEIARLGDCPVLLERADGAVRVLHDSVLSAIEANIKARITAMKSQGATDAAAVLAQMTPFLRDVRRRRNRAGGYGVLAADRACLDLLQVDRFLADDLRSILLVSDGYYRLVDVYGAMSDAELVRRTAEARAETLLAELRAIEAADRHGHRHPRLKMADDATALLLRHAEG